MGRNIPSWFSAYNAALNAYTQFGTTGDTSKCTGPLPIAFAYTWNPPGINGGNYPVIFCHVTVAETLPTIGPPFNVQVTDWGYHIKPLQSVVLPDLTAWTFQYTNDGNGDLAQITFPTGGTIAYTWTSPPVLEGTQGYIFTRGIATRTLNPNDGVNPSGQWTYNYGVNFSALRHTTTVVTDPAGNDTAHTFTGLAPTCSSAFYETLTQSYQGLYTNGTLLKTVQTDYGFNGGSPCVYPGVTGVVPIRKTTTWPNGQQSKVETDYGSQFTFFPQAFWDAKGNWNAGPSPQSTTYGRVTATREFDYGNILVRTTSTPRWAFGHPNYLAANLLDLKSSDIVQDGNNCKLAETDYTYDEATYLTTYNGTLPAGTHVAPVNPAPVRGNPTTATRQLFSTLACPYTAQPGPSSHINWYDTGEPYQQIDPLSNPTTQTYDPAYAGAYSTQTCLPTTNGVNHCVNRTYDFNTGVVTSITDQNQQITNFSYDTRLRLTQKLSPPVNGVRPETDFDYSVPTQVKRSKKQDATHWIIDYTYVDGLGRTKQTRLVDPEGDDFVDTTSDALGRVSTVSNPHRSFSESTFGLTSYGYDALGRTTDVVKADGSAVHTDYSGNVNTVTDEAGHTRRTTVDTLGRMTELDEPGASSALGTPGAVARVSGSISGHVQMDPAVLSAVLQTINTLLLSDSSGTTTSTTAPAATSTSTSTPNPTAAPNPASPSPAEAITNAPAATTASAPANPNYDTGKVWLSIKGFRATAYYQQGSTAGSIARDLAGQFNVAGSPVFARVDGDSQLILLSRIPGTAGNLTIDNQGTQSDNPSKYPNPSFTISMSPSNWSNAAPGDLSSPLVTLYQYDALGNLLRVDQKGTAPNDSTQWRTRTFAYDSLSRLLTASNPESGTMNYSYDANGNVSQKTSPAPNQTGTATQTISYCYDQLNRVTGKAYSPQNCPLTSPAVTWTYDAGANGIGHMTSLTDQAGSASYSYDAMGRMASATRTTNGISKSMSYGYNLDSSLKTLTYPSGAVITYTPDGAGRMLSAIDNGTGINYVTGATYSAGGPLTSFVSGGSLSGITNSFSFNQRLQPVTISAALPTQTLFSLTYDFHFGAGDNGNVFAISNNKDTTRSRSFSYDALNRLTSAQNAGSDCTVQLPDGHTKFWGNNYGYDAWGNLLSKSPTKCTPESMSVTALANNQLSGYGYDAPGNMTSGHMNSDPTVVVTATYDAENRIATAASTKNSTTTTTNYAYDAAGNRVEKSNSTGGTLYWYMSPGIVGESDLLGNLQSEYVFFDGQRVARKDLPSGAVSYYFSDLLKTTNVVTDAQGTIKNESDFYPWGGDLQFANGDSNHYKFTGKERDNETGLDYFGARYYSNQLGRFITPDWSAGPVPVPYADLADPQTLNQYSYVRGLPTTKADLDGHGCPPICAGPLLPPMTPQEWKEVGTNLGQGLANAAVNLLNFAGHLTLPGQLTGLQIKKPFPNAAPAAKLVEYTAPAAIPLGGVGNTAAAPEVLADSALVVRGGVPTAAQLTKGAENIAADGTLNGVSVQSANGATVEQLSQGIPNNQIGVTTVGEVRAAGGDVVPTPKPGNPCHCDMNGVTAEQGTKLFKAQPNPSKVKNPQDVD